jgi:hypothetical protein
MVGALDDLSSKDSSLLSEICKSRVRTITWKGQRRKDSRSRGNRLCVEPSCLTHRRPIQSLTVPPWSMLRNGAQPTNSSLLTEFASSDRNYQDMAGLSMEIRPRKLRPAAESKQSRVEGRISIKEHLEPDTSFADGRRSF